MTDTAVARSSDDFWPRDPASHTTHVAVNAINSLFMSALVQPDWDMFHSQHPAALLHASARVVRALVTTALLECFGVRSPWFFSWCPGVKHRQEGAMPA